MLIIYKVYRLINERPQHVNDFFMRYRAIYIQASEEFYALLIFCHRNILAYSKKISNKNSKKGYNGLMANWKGHVVGGVALGVGYAAVMTMVPVERFAEMAGLLHDWQ